MLKCEKCSRNIPEDARLCPYCGTPITGRQKITEKVYRGTLNNLKQFITKSPIDTKGARVIDWTKHEIKSKPKKPKSFYLIIIIMFITLSVIMALILF